MIILKIKIVIITIIIDKLKRSLYNQSKEN